MKRYGSKKINPMYAVLMVALLAIPIFAGCGGGGGGGAAARGDAVTPASGGAAETNADAAAELASIQEAITADGAEWQAGETEISLLPDDQRTQLNGLLLDENPESVTDETEEAGRVSGREAALTTPLPSSFDWRSKDGANWLGAVKQQGICASCSAFSSLGAMEALYRIGLNKPDVDVDFAESDVFSCAGAQCAGALYISAMFYRLKLYGVADEECLPYQPQNGMCPLKCADWKQRSTKISTYKYVYPKQEYIKSALLFGPVVAGMAVYTDFYYYTGGVYKKVWGLLKGYRAVMIVGWDDAGGYWIVRNSWGTGWGEGGYAKIAYGNSLIERYVYSMTLGANLADVEASASAPVTSGGAASLTLTCATTATGTVTMLEGRCDSAGAWSAFATGTTTMPCSYTVAGSYTPECRVNRVVSDAVDAPVVLGGLNSAPAATISPATASGTFPFTVAFTGGCTDADGSCVSYLWDFGDGTPTSAEQNPAHSYAKAGVFTAKLTVTDNAGATGIATLTVYVTSGTNRPPKAVAYASPVTGVVPLIVNFNGVCYDYDGKCLSYTWDFGDGTPMPGSIHKTPAHSYTASGTYYALLTVMDDRAAVGTATVKIIAKDNNAPAATITFIPKTGKVPVKIYFAAACKDYDGGCNYLTWDFGDGGPAYSAASAYASHTYTASGTYAVSVTIKDGYGLEKVATATVAVTKNVPPVPLINSNKESGLPPLTVSFYGSCTDIDGKCVNYYWNFGDGSATATAINTAHKFSNVGTYTVTLSARDNNGEYGYATKDIYVRPNQLPVGSITATPATGAAPLNVNFAADCTDSDGACATFLWSFGDGTPNSSFRNPPHTFAAAGTYTVTLTVTDNLGGQSTTQTTVTVEPPPVPPVEHKKIVAGRRHTCMITPSGGVQCWGDNSYDQLGTGTKTPSATPVDVPGLSSGVIDIAAGAFSACVLKSNGNIKCWGFDVIDWESNPYDIISMKLQENLSGGVSALKLSAGNFSQCMLLENNGAACWGWENYYQMGYYNGSYVTTDVASGGDHNCTMASDGTVRCWGRAKEGQTSCDESYSGDYVVFDPNDCIVPGTAGVTKAIFAGYNESCAKMNDGTVKCWGSNEFGQLGNGYAVSGPTYIPVAVSGLSDVKTMSIGDGFACALLNSGVVKCWGRNLEGQLGNGTFTNSATPVSVSGISFTPVDIAAGGYHTCVVSATGGKYCWGGNEYGQLGNGANSWSGGTGFPSSEVVQITSGVSHTCTLNVSGGVKCWGQNEYGQLGNGSFEESDFPRDVIGLSSGVIKISSGPFITCAVTAAGGVKCWGTSAWNESSAGIGMPSSVPFDVPGMSSGVADISIGDYQSYALMTGGTVKGWGEDRDTFPAGLFDVPSLTDATLVSAGRGIGCYITTGGVVMCSGINFNGIFGDGTHVCNGGYIEYSSGPIQVANLPAGIVDVQFGFDWSYNVTGYALAAGGAIYKWGGIDNDSECSSDNDGHVQQLDVPAGLTAFHIAEDSRSFVYLYGSDVKVYEGQNYELNTIAIDAKAVTNGDNHFCAILNDGKVWCRTIQLEPNYYQYQLARSIYTPGL